MKYHVNETETVCDVDEMVCIRIKLKRSKDFFRFFVSFKLLKVKTVGLLLTNSLSKLIGVIKNIDYYVVFEHIASSISDTKTTLRYLLLIGNDIW
jgi:hypothetical protein